MPSPPSCRRDHAPSVADRFILGMSPLDDDPVVLRKPCGPRLTASALPSGVLPEGAPGPPWRCPACACVPVSGSPYLPLSGR
jgi:hypothetical protein